MLITHRAYYTTGLGISLDDVHDEPCECPIGSDHYMDSKKKRELLKQREQRET